MPSDATSPSLPIWKALVFSLIVVGLIFGAVEGALILSDYPPKGITRGIHGSSFWVAEPNLDNGAFLHKEVGTNFGVSTNSKSLRYREVPLGRQDGVLRIMALGDSTTFGWGVEQTKTYPQVLETMLAGKAPGLDIEVINGGQPGYSTFQGLHHMRARAVEFAADIYLIGYIVQDAREAPISDKNQAISNRSKEFFAANPLYRWRTYLWLRNKYQNYRSAKRETEAKGGGTTRVTPEEFAENIRELASLARKADGLPVLFGFPLEVVGYTKAHREVMGQVAKEDSLLYFDPSQAVFEAARKQTLYFPQDRGHPNAAGCNVIARETAQWLETSGVLAETAAGRN